MRMYLLNVVETFCSKQYVPRTFLRHLSFLLNNGILFDEFPNASLQESEMCFRTLNIIIVFYRNELSIQDLQNIVFRYCVYIEHPNADFQLSQNLIDILTELVGVMRLHISAHRDEVCRRFLAAID